MVVTGFLSAGIILAGCWRGQAGTGMQQQGTIALPQEEDSTRAAIDSGIITRSEIALGDSVFNGRNGDGICATCHGQNGVGTGAAPNLTDRQWINGDGSIGFIKGTVYQGVPHPKQHPLPMPPLGHTLTEQQLQAVAAYVYALSHRPIRKTR